MSSLDFLHYILSVAIIVIALTSIAVGISVIFLLQEIRVVLRSIHKTAHSIERARDAMKSGVLGGIISFSENFFGKKSRND